MKVFISWSKEKSRRIAEAMHVFLEGLFHDKVETWISCESIPYGTMHINSINQALHECEKCIACLTKDNYTSPWIMYEVGAISSNNYALKKGATSDVIFPILFENINKTEFQGNPLGQFQMVDFIESHMRRLVKQINNKVKSFSNESILERQFQLNWNVLNNTIKKILDDYTILGGKSLNCQLLMQEFEKNNFTSPDKGDVIRYYDGFETQKMYEVLLNNADKRLWLFGRKNRKLFANDNRFFFEDLGRRIKNGFDFKCLFLNPNATESVANAQRITNFLDNLNTCIHNAYDMLSNNNIEPNNVCRAYSTLRTDEIIVIDNVVIFSHIYFDNQNLPFPLTRSAFYMADIDNSIGKRYVSNFSLAWNNAEPIPFPQLMKN